MSASLAQLNWLAIIGAGGAGFAAILSSWSAVFAQWPWRLWLINNGCYLTIQIVTAVILTLWQ